MTKPPEQAPTEIFAYLDHNVLDLMTKGDPLQVRQLLRNANLTPVYSWVSLEEIHQSKGHEMDFIGLLDEIGARFIEPLLDEKFRATGQARVHSISPRNQYENFLQHQSENPHGDFGFSDILLKFYGGKPDVPFAEVFETPLNNVFEHLMRLLDDIEGLPDELKPHIELVKEMATSVPEALRHHMEPMITQLDEMGSPASAFNAKIGIGPLTLNNINPPNVVQQVWKHVASKMDEDSLDLERFFGLKPQAFNPDIDQELILQEKVNAIYHQLNFLGYYRDSKMKKERRFHASFRDMTHAGIAAYCHVFICRDANLVMKTKAAYEFLGIKTIVIFYPSENQKNSAMLSQFNRYKSHIGSSRSEER